MRSLLRLALALLCLIPLFSPQLSAQAVRYDSFSATTNSQCASGAALRYPFTLEATNNPRCMGIAHAVFSRQINNALPSAESGLHFGYLFYRQNALHLLWSEMRLMVVAAPDGVWLSHAAMSISPCEEVRSEACPVLVSDMCPALREHIARVVGIGAGKQVLPVAARWIVTGMAGDKTSEVAVEFHRKGNAMCPAMQCVRVVESTVSVSVNLAEPRPALVWIADFQKFPKSKMLQVVKGRDWFSIVVSHFTLQAGDVVRIRDSVDSASLICILPHGEIA